MNMHIYLCIDIYTIYTIDAIQYRYIAIWSFLHGSQGLR